MKNFKLIFVLVISLLLIGCKDDNKQNIESKANNINYIAANRDFYQNGLIYQSVTHKASYLDFETMKSVTLCSIPNCTHTTGSCLGEQLEATPIMYNDYAYSFSANTQVIETPDGRELSISSKLRKVSLSNSEFEDVCKFTDCTPRIGEGYVLCDNLLYFIGHDENPHEDEYGNISYLSVGGKEYLCCINLENGDYKNYGLICYVEDKYPMADTSGSSKILGCYNKKIYIGYSFLKEESSADNSNKWQLLNYEFDLDTKTIKESELPYAAFIDDDFYVYYDKETESIVVLNNDKNYNIPDCVVDMYAPVYNGKMFTYDGFYDLSTLSKHDFPADDDKYKVITYYNGYYIITHGSEFLKLTEEELLALDKGE